MHTSCTRAILTLFLFYSSRGFSELQTFDPKKTAARAKGKVYELLCFGPHEVELLSTAVRKLEPLGLRLLHAAHSHEDGHSTKAEIGQRVSRFFMEKMQTTDVDVDGVENETLTDMVLKVLMTTYKMSDEVEFSVKPGKPPFQPNPHCRVGRREVQASGPSGHQGSWRESCVELGGLVVSDLGSARCVSAVVSAG